MRHVLRVWLLAATLAAGGAATAQERRPSVDSSDILVTGERDRERQVRNFIGALTDAPVGGQLGRFDWSKACPGASGLSAEQNAAVTERMRQVAAAAGIPLDEPGCRPNALVLVTRDKDALIEWLRREYPALFRDGAGRSIRVPRQEGPVLAWHLEGLLNSDGTLAAADSDGRYIVEATTVGRIAPNSRPYFRGSVVVIELEALAGLTTTQLADYAAMRSFARTDPRRLASQTAPTILKVLDAPMGSEVPITLTQWDLGFLRALYGSDENAYAARQRGEMRRLLEEELVRGQQTRN